MYKNGDYKEYFDVNGMRVFGFFEQYRFLSNFFQCNVWYDGLPWPSAEHAYVVAKCDDSYYAGFEKFPRYDNKKYETIIDMTPSQVKKWGQKVNLREDWEDVKLEIMYEICYSKFEHNDILKQKLLDTGDRFLIEANNWNDSFWGYDVKKKQGENNLGKILMKVRDILKDDVR
jgi:ribA/ribD-fused uncharacterized protein